MTNREFWKRMRQMDAAIHYAHQAIGQGEIAKAQAVCREVIGPRIVIFWRVGLKPYALKRGWIEES